MQDYKSRLTIPLIGNSTTIFTTKSGQEIAIGYNRIVIGERGPYIEFDDIIVDNSIIPPDQKWRLYSDVAYYVERRTTSDNIKIYHQRLTVNYADYKIGKYYISPFDLYVDGNVVIKKLTNKGIKNDNIYKW